MLDAAWYASLRVTIPSTLLDISGKMSGKLENVCHTLTPEIKADNLPRSAMIDLGFCVELQSQQ